MTSPRPGIGVALPILIMDVPSVYAVAILACLVLFGLS
jgi:hypothetical protein